MNTKVNFKIPPTTTTLNFLISSRHKKILKFGIKLYQTKQNPNLKKIYQKNSKIYKFFVRKTTIFKLNTIASRLVLF